MSRIGTCSPLALPLLLCCFCTLERVLGINYSVPLDLNIAEPPLNLHSVPCDPPRFSDYNICTTEKFFIYDHFPPELVSLWPKRDGELRKHYRANNGTGEFFNKSLGMHETHQFTVFTPIYRRLLNDYRRTLDPAEATAFFIPYDMGFDAAIKKDSAKIRPQGCPHAEAVIALLEDNKYFRRNFGYDHFLVQGLNQAMGNFNMRPACKLFLKGFCENCTKLAIDTYWACGPSPHWHAIPFPSNFHWNSNISVPPWAQPDRPRKYAVSFTGSTSSFSRKSVIVRKKMKTDCEKHPECFTNLMNSHFDVRLSDAAKYVNLDSIFCLNPPGDMPTRKGFFDTILAGCIPVTTDHYSAYDQWFWHLGREIHDKTSIYIPKSKFMSKDFNFMQYLVDLVHESEGGRGLVVDMRRNIAKYAARLQYRLPETSLSQLPPRDATDVIIDRVFETNINVSTLVTTPGDRGDWRSIDKFPFYPVGRKVTRFRLEEGESFNRANKQAWEMVL
mmetsp:Transcript_18931/g.31626  ORF Transcript_18931/g.31626 Transcript_18931/m.31626 type:complete len:501 (+) Transcript_18931:158-1660(+)